MILSQVLFLILYFVFLLEILIILGDLVETTLTEINECNQQIDFTLTQDELIPHFELSYLKAAPNIEIKGFRKGKVPLTLIKKYYGQSIELESVENIANECFRQTITEKNLQPIGMPSLVDIKYNSGEPLKFTVKFEIRPSFELQEYKGVEAKKYSHLVTDEEIQNELKRLQQSNATYEDVKIVDGKDFVVTVDMQELDENKNPIASKKNDGVKINLTESTTEVEILDVLKNAELDKEYFAEFEHKHNDHSHAVHLQMIVRKIEKIILPNLDEELIKKITKDKISDVEEFRTGLKKDLENYWQEEFEKRFLDEIVNSIVSKYNFSVPESLVSNILDGFIEELKSQLGGKQLPKGFDTTKYKESLRPRALWQAKWFLIREEIINKENLTISDEDLSLRAEEESVKIGIDKETLLNFYKTSEKSKENLLNEKFFALLKENAKVTVLDDSEIPKQ